MSAARDEDMPNVSRVQILRACKENTIYKKYRWANLDRNKPDGTIQNLPETVLKKGVDPKIGLVAMLNLEKSEIVKVFENAKKAGEDRQLKSGASISRAIRQGTQSRGHYFRLWYECEETLKTEFLKNNSLPIRIPTKNSKRVIRIDKEGNTIIYGCIEDVTKKHNMSRQTLKDAINNDYPAKGFKWKFEK